MTNRYEPPEVIGIGKAQDVILDQKCIALYVDNIGIVFMYNGETMDDFDE